MLNDAFGEATICVPEYEPYMELWSPAGDSREGNIIYEDYHVPAGSPIGLAFDSSHKEYRMGLVITIPPYIANQQVLSPFDKIGDEYSFAISSGDLKILPEKLDQPMGWPMRIPADIERDTITISIELYYMLDILDYSHISVFSQPYQRKIIYTLHIFRPEEKGETEKIPVSTLQVQSLLNRVRHKPL